MGYRLDDWNKIYQQVVDERGSGTIKFDRDVATRLAELCALMVNGIDQVVGNIDSVTKLPDFGTKEAGALEAGNLLAQKFVRAANDLHDRVLPEHKEILNKMGQTFLSAISTMESQDQDSADAFKKVQSRVDSSGSSNDGSPFGYQPETNGRYNWDTSQDKGSVSPGGKGMWVDDYGFVEYTPEFSDKLDGLSELVELQKRITGDRDASDIKLDHSRGENLKWNDLYANFSYLDHTSDTILAAANSWKGFSDVLAVEAARFTAGFAEQFGKGGFSGDGAEAAVGAGKDYGTQLSKLTDALDIIGENLRISASWMYKTHWYMPEMDAQAFWAKHPDQTVFLTEYNSDQTKWNEWWVVGATAASNCIPTLPSVDGSKSPMAPAPAPDKPGDKPDPNADKPGPNTDKPATNTGSPAATPSTPSVPDTKQPDDKQPTKDNPTDTKQPTNTQNTDLSTLASTLSTIAQQGVSMIETLAQDGSSLVQSLLSSQSTQKTTDTTGQQLEQQLASLLNTPTTPTTPTSPGGTPGGTPTGGTPTTPKVESPKTSLFPRASVTTDEKTETETASRAGLATGSTTSTGTSTGSGMGSPMGGAGAAGQSGGKEHKRPDYLKSAENFAEALGVLPEAVTPVADVEK